MEVSNGKATVEEVKSITEKLKTIATVEEVKAINDRLDELDIEFQKDIKHGNNTKTMKFGEKHNGIN